MEGFCRACLNKFNESTELLHYCESNRRLFVYCTGLQVKRNDTFTFQLCKECYINLKSSCKFKKQCRTSDKKLKTYLALKKDGESIDFTTYLKNNEDALTLRLPIPSRNNTPAHQKNDDDDDNVSTCTSIQNFMSDMLQDEEMLPTEARIIREVIQEEADILDDSLDSHWLQDDMSVDNDFGMDFNFAGFSTPHSINNDHCYTPRRLTNDKEDEPYYYTPKYTKFDPQKSDEAYVAQDQRDMPLLENTENNQEYDFNDIVKPEKQEMNASIQIDMPLLDACDIELDGIVDDNITMDDLEKEFRIDATEKTNNHITIILNKGVASKLTKSPLTNELEYYMNKVELNRINSTKTDGNCDSSFLNNEKNIGAVFNHDKVDAKKQSTLSKDFDQHIDKAKLNLNLSENIVNLESPVTLELEKYINRAELKKKNHTDSNLGKDIISYNEKCSIDKNLEMALQNDESQEFSLDQLLISPQVSLRSGASTPTINNILFGNLTPRNTDTNVPVSKSITIRKENIIPPDFIEEFLINECQRQSTPKKEPTEVVRRQYIRVKDLNKLKMVTRKSLRKMVKGDLKDHIDTKSQRNKQNRGHRGYKDINRLKDLVFENNNHSETLDGEMLDSEQTHPIDRIENLEANNQISKKNNDLDMSISNLLNLDDNQSVDLNVSIDSDFLKEDKLEEDISENCKDPENTFKVPFSPPDNKYDLNKSLCKICDKTCKSKGALKLHFLRIHKQQLPKIKKIRNVVSKVCPECGKSFRDHSNFNRHMKSHEEPDSFKCEYCTLEFPTRGRFNQHMRAHIDEISSKENKDVVKNEQNESDENTDEHCKEEEKSRKKSYVCTTCGKEFKTVSNFYVHVRRHNKTYTRKCEVCQKGFIRKYDLDMHMISHNQEHHFECQYCSKKYKHRYLLVGHMYRHLGKDTFKCEVCDRNFISKQRLKQHYGTEMCANNRKALDEGRNCADVTVKYKPYVCRSPKTPEKSTKVRPENVLEDETIDIKTELCIELIEEDAIKDELEP